MSGRWCRTLDASLLCGRSWFVFTALTLEVGCGGNDTHPASEGNAMGGASGNGTSAVAGNTGGAPSVGGSGTGGAAIGGQNSAVGTTANAGSSSITTGGQLTLGGSTNLGGSSTTSSSNATDGTRAGGGTVSTGGRSNSGGNGGASTGGTQTTSAGTTNGGTASGGKSSGTGGLATGGVSNTSGGDTNQTQPDVIANITNGVFWNDTAGNRIEAHGGGFILVDGTWYWFGEDKSQNSANFKAVNCYASADLQHWEFRKAVVTRSTSSSLNDANRIIERPKVIYNDSTKQYVMWLHWEGKDYAEAAAGVFTSPTIDGAYTFKSQFRPNNNMSRDDNLFKDDDGRAYFMSAANENKDMIIYELSDDYLSIKKQLVTLWPSSWREAPAMFKQGATYFLITSAATGWDPNQAQYATASAIGGPYTSLTNLGNDTTFDSQSTYVIPVKGSKTTTYIFAADRWQDPDLVGSKYIWLPLKINGTSLSLSYHDKWQLNLTTGNWSASDGFVPRADWTLLYVDSEETVGENGAAANAFDDDGYTYWHTAWKNSQPDFPHEIQIDLGATYDLTAFRYLPRQDKDDHGMVAKYEFYASADAKNWGTALASGTFDSSRTEKIATFAKKTARYIRFVGLSEINGNYYASAGEIDVQGTKL